jgi:hypothetical protein
MSCLATLPDGRCLSVRGTYAAPPGPDWGWRIEIVPDTHALRITHYSIHPDGTEDFAAEGSIRGRETSGAGSHGWPAA